MFAVLLGRCLLELLNLLLKVGVVPGVLFELLQLRLGGLLGGLELLALLVDLVEAVLGDVALQLLRRCGGYDSFVSRFSPVLSWPGLRPVPMAKSPQPESNRHARAEMRKMLCRAAEWPIPLRAASRRSAPDGVELWPVGPCESVCGTVRGMKKARCGVHRA